MNGYKISEQVVRTLRHILDARIDNSCNPDQYTAWTSARAIIEYALTNNIECLSQFDYLMTQEEKDVAKYWCEGR